MFGNLQHRSIWQIILLNFLYQKIFLLEYLNTQKIFSQKIYYEVDNCDIVAVVMKLDQ